MEVALVSQLTIGPVLFHWPAGKWRDYYFRIADEAPADTVYIGEVVCSKRSPFYEPLYEEVSERLKRGGKKVVFSTLAEVMIKRDRKSVEGLCSLDDTLIEANDASALWFLSGRPHAVGPFLNVYNEDALTFLALKGAEHICLPFELPAQSLSAMAKKGNELVVTTEVQIYGRIPLALSARCYHARAHGRVKDNCQFVCEKDPDGMELKTMQGKPFLTVNGIQTMSYTCLNLAQEVEEMKNMGITHFRLSPHSHDMVETAKLFRSLLDNAVSPEDIAARLRETGLKVPFSNGFYHKKEGYKWNGKA
jgi:collagenase-like PrtC family protease